MRNWYPEFIKDFFNQQKWNKWIKKWDLPGGPVVKNPPANAGDMNSIPGPARSHMSWGN